MHGWIKQLPFSQLHCTVVCQNEVRSLCAVAGVVCLGALTVQMLNEMVTMGKAVNLKPVQRILLTWCAFVLLFATVACSSAQRAGSFVEHVENQVRAGVCSTSRVQSPFCRMVIERPKRSTHLYVCHVATKKVACLSDWCYLSCESYAGTSYVF